MRKPLIASSILVAAYLFGAMSERHQVFPWPQLISLKDRIEDDPAEQSRYLFDNNKLLIADESKTAMACPKQTTKTYVLLVLGQSNASNHAGQRYKSNYGEKITNFFDGRCYIAASPLLGSTDTRGEYWTQLGNLLIESGDADKVVIAPLAISGSEVKRWASGGDINKLLVETAQQLQQSGYRVTNVLWDQGEADYVIGTSEAQYQERFLSMVHTLRQENIDAPIYITIASKCLEPSNGGTKTHNPDNPVVRAQLALAESGNGLRLGVDTDTMLSEVDRYDDCHIGGSGTAKVARAWANMLLADDTSRQQRPVRTSLLTR